MDDDYHFVVTCDIIQAIISKPYNRAIDVGIWKARRPQQPHWEIVFEWFKKPLCVSARCQILVFVSSINIFIFGISTENNGEHFHVRGGRLHLCEKHPLVSDRSGCWHWFPSVNPSLWSGSHAERAKQMPPTAVVDSRTRARLLARNFLVGGRKCLYNIQGEKDPTFLRPSLDLSLHSHQISRDGPGMFW